MYYKREFLNIQNVKHPSGKEAINYCRDQSNLNAQVNILLMLLGQKRKAAKGMGKKQVKINK